MVKFDYYRCPLCFLLLGVSEREGGERTNPAFKYNSLLSSQREIFVLHGKHLENAREQLGAPFHTLAINITLVKAGKSHIMCLVSMSSGQVAII